MFEVMPLLSRAPIDTTARATSASHRPIERHGWVALVRARRSVNDRPLPVSALPLRCTDPLITTPHSLALHPCGPGGRSLPAPRPRRRRPGVGNRGQPREDIRGGSPGYSAPRVTSPGVASAPPAGRPGARPRAGRVTGGGDDRLRRSSPTEVLRPCPYPPSAARSALPRPTRRRPRPDRHAGSAARYRRARAQHRRHGGLRGRRPGEAPAARQDPQVRRDRPPAARRRGGRHHLRQGGRGRGPGRGRHSGHPDRQPGGRADQDRPPRRPRPSLHRDDRRRRRRQRGATRRRRGAGRCRHSLYVEVDVGMARCGVPDTAPPHSPWRAWSRRRRPWSSPVCRPTRVTCRTSCRWPSGSPAPSTTWPGREPPERRSRPAV